MLNVLDVLNAGRPTYQKKKKLVSAKRAAAKYTHDAIGMKAIKYPTVLPQFCDPLPPVRYLFCFYASRGLLVMLATLQLCTGI